MKKLFTFSKFVLLGLSILFTACNEAVPEKAEVRQDSLVKNEMPIKAEVDSISAQTPVFTLTFDTSEVKQWECMEKGKLKSSRSRNSTYIEFTNESSRDLKLSWINFKGKLEFYQNIKIGKKHTQQTYLTHPWIIEDAKTGECLGIVGAKKANSKNSVVCKF